MIFLILLFFSSSALAYNFSTQVAAYDACVAWLGTGGGTTSYLTNGCYVSQRTNGSLSLQYCSTERVCISPRSYQAVSGGGTSCLCPGVDKTYISTSNICVDNCQNGFVMQLDGTCSCPFGNEVVNNTCLLQCSGGQVRGSDLSCACPSGSSLLNGVCAADCLSPLVRTNGGSCVCPGTNDVFVPELNACHESCREPGSLVSGYQLPTEIYCHPICQVGSHSEHLTAEREVCVCDSYDASGCACPAGYSNLPSNIRICLPYCQQNVIYENLECICPTGTSAYQSATGNICAQTCPNGQIYNFNSLSCGCALSGEELLLGVCVAVCPAGQVRASDGTCGCPSGQELVSGQCVAVCPAGQVRASDGTCGCPSGQELVSGQCVAVCPAGQVRGSNGTCGCPSGQELVSGQCVAVCPAGQVRASDGTCGCPSGQELVSGQCVAVCPAGQVRASDGTCGCPSGQELVSGQCVAVCPAGQVRGSNGTCGCPSGQELVSGQCVAVCPAGQVRASDGTCGCPSGQELVSGQCVAVCPAGQSRGSNGTCALACPAAWELQNGICVLVGCPSGQELFSGNCVAVCPVNTYRDQTTGQCVSIGDGTGGTGDGTGGTGDGTGGTGDGTGGTGDGTGGTGDGTGGTGDGTGGTGGGTGGTGGGTGLPCDPAREVCNPNSVTNNPMPEYQPPQIPDYSYGDYLSNIFDRVSQLSILDAPSFACSHNISCPPFAFSLGRLGSFSTDSHCDLINVASPSVNAFLIVLACVISFRIVMSA